MASEVLVDGDFNSHVRSDMGGFGEVYGVLGLGKEMMEGLDCWTGHLVKGYTWWILVSIKWNAGS